MNNTNKDEGINSTPQARLGDPVESNISSEPEDTSKAILNNPEFGKKDNANESKERFKAIIEATDTGFVVLDGNGFVLEANLQYVHLAGYTSMQEIIGRHVTEWTAPHDIERNNAEIKKCVENGNVRNFEIEYIHGDGKLIPIEINAHSAMSQNGVTIVTLCRDITHRKRIEDANRKSQEYLTKITNSIDETIYSVNGITGEFEFLSPAFERKFGYSISDIMEMGGRWKFLSHVVQDEDHLSEDPITTDLRINKVEQSPVCEHWWKCKNGSLLYIEDRWVTTYNGTQLIRIDGVLRDITRHKKTEIALKESEERYRRITGAITDYIYTVYVENGRIIRTRHSPGCIAVTGYAEHEFEKEPYLWFTMVSPEDRGRVLQQSQMILEGINPPPLEHRIIRKDGSVRWVRNTHVAFLDENGSLLSYDGLVQDITERKFTENALNESEFFLQKSQSVAKIGSYYFDIKIGKWITSKGLDEIFGIDFRFEKDLDGWYNLIHPEDKDKIINYFKQHVLVAHNRFDKEYRIVRIIDNQERWVHQLGELEFDEHGHITKMIGTIQDITDWKSAEIALQLSEEKFRSIFENSTAGIALVNLDGSYLVVNKAYSKILGYTSDELVKMDFLNITHPEDLEISKKIMYDLKNSEEKTHSFKKRYLHKDGHTIIAEVNSTIVNDSNGKPLYFITHLIDITQRMAAEEQSRILFEATEQSAVSITIVEKSGIINYVNPRFEEMTGYSANEVIGKDFWFLKSSEATPEINRQIWDTIGAGNIWKGEFLRKKKNGKLFWESTSISPIKNNNGEITHFVFTEEDITEKKNLIEQIIIAKERAEEMNRLKSSFLANMSHELRTPLVGLLGFAAILEEELDSEHKEFASIINQSGKRLVTTLNEILSYSEIEANKVELLKHDVCITSLVREEVDLFQSIAQRKDLYFKIELCEDLFTYSDEILLRKILDNLINNAIKFTLTGGITISLSHNESEAILIVSDTGIGIPKEKQEMIFDEFRQASEGRTRNFDGTGLGLTIVKKYVEMLNGKITVESECDKGSSFIVKIPISNIRTNIKSANTNTVELKKFIKVNFNDDRKCDILLVEDEELNALAIQRMISKNFNVTHVTNAHDAIENVGRKKFAVILMDINLKHNMSGIEAVKVIREINEYETVPIVAMTAFAMQKDKEEFLAKGCSHFIAKPFTKEEILGLMEEILHQNMN